MFLILPFVLFAGFDWSTVDLTDPEHFAQGQIKVRFADDADISRIQSAILAQEASVVKRIEELNVMQLKLAEGKDVLETLEYYEAQPDVIYAEPVMIHRAFWTPNDPQYGYQWHFDGNHINMPDAWDKERGHSGVIIAIVDTGIAFEDYDIPSHEEGEVYSSDGYYHACPDFTASQFVSGYDYVHDDAHPNDQNGHGTHVAGTVAQATDNGIGVAGMAPNCKLMPIQVLGYDGSGYDTWIADGIIFAADSGADVINMSLGGLPGVPSQTEHDAIKYAVNKGVVVVAAAGNEGVGEMSYPGGFEECIGVAACDYNNVLSYYSQYGNGLDISAPGGDVTVDLNSDGKADGVCQVTYTNPGGEYTGAWVDEFSLTWWQGTSMASPHVSGLAALLISHGITGVSNVKAAIYSTADDIGNPFYYGYGMINPSKALDYGGSGDVVLQIPVVQNPLLAQHADMWVVPTMGTLFSAPQVTVDDESVSMYSVPGSNAYVGDYEFTSTGTFTIEASGGGASKTRQFSVETVTVAGGMISSPDGKCYLDVPAGAVPISTYFTAADEEMQASRTPNKPYETEVLKDALPIGPAYRFGPGGLNIHSPASLHLSYAWLSGIEPSHLVLMAYQEGSWTAVPSYIDRERREVVASVEKLGIFQLAKDATQSTPDLPQVLDLRLIDATPLPGDLVARLSLAEEISLTLAVFDATGRKVNTLVAGTLPAGEYDYRWEDTDQTGRCLSPGVYFIHLETPSRVRNLKVISLH